MTIGKIIRIAAFTLAMPAAALAQAPAGSTPPGTGMPQGSDTDKPPPSGTDTAQPPRDTMPSDTREGGPKDTTDTTRKHDDTKSKQRSNPNDPTKQ
jgi:hypothetical protein